MVSVLVIKSNLKWSNPKLGQFNSIISCLDLPFCNPGCLSLTPSLTCQSVSASSLRNLISGALPSQDLLSALSGVLWVCC